jgi:hypothetical protein
MTSWCGFCERWATSAAVYSVSDASSSQHAPEQQHLLHVNQRQSSNACFT